MWHLIKWGHLGFVPTKIWREFIDAYPRYQNTFFSISFKISSHHMQGCRKGEAGGGGMPSQILVHPRLALRIFGRHVTICQPPQIFRPFDIPDVILVAHWDLTIYVCSWQKKWYFTTYQSNLNYALKSGTYLSYGLCIVMVVMLNEICLHDSPTFRKTILYDSALSGMMAKFGSIVKIWKVCKITYLLGFSI